MTYYRHIAVALALFAGTAAASAQTTVITREPVPAGTVVTTQPLILAPAQRQLVYRGIVRERTTTGAAGAVEYRVGTRVPGTVHLYTVPDSVAVEVPAVKQYHYMVVNGRVVLVDPVTSEVVAELSD